MKRKLNNVLLVDDNNFNNYYNKNLIEELGIATKIRIVTNGLEALQLIKKDLGSYGSTLPELILLDLIMPEMDGLEFIKEFQKINFGGKEKPRIIILTAVGSDSNIMNLYTLGINEIINKPLTEQNLMNSIDKHF